MPISRNAQPTMSSRLPVPQVSARTGAMIVQMAAAMGANATRLTQAAGFTPAGSDAADARIPLEVEQRLWEQAAALTGDPLFGLHAAALIQPGAFGVLDYAVRTAPDLGTALQRLVRYNRLVHDLATFDVIPAGDVVRIEHRFQGSAARPCRHATEFTLASLVVMATQIAGEAVQALAVGLPHPAAGDAADFRQVFGVTPAFNAPVSFLALPAAVLDRPVPAADPGLSRIITDHAEHLLAAYTPHRANTVLRVRRHLLEGLADRPMTLQAVARALHMSERSLQRRLQEEGARFADLLDAVRRELAMRYMADPRLALGEVAYLLGYAEPSAFQRAFKRWTGITPTAARQRNH
ncbi:MAG: AraC family transcriptional regulator [Azovibrio sp.]|nr:AraC family transcriptional regulator [Azovibrio sp.]